MFVCLYPEIDHRTTNSAQSLEYGLDDSVFLAYMLGTTHIYKFELVKCTLVLNLQKEATH